jgi:hypothetical protein
MKKLIIILFCLPLIGFGQITVQEAKKDKNPIVLENFMNDLKYSVELGVKLEHGSDLAAVYWWGPEVSFTDERITTNVFYLNSTIEKNLYINKSLYFYNQLSLCVNLRTRDSTITYLEYSAHDTTILDPYLVITPKKYFAYINNQFGLSHIINDKISQRVGVKIKLVPIYRSISHPHKDYVDWFVWMDDIWGGFTYQIDYSINSNIMCNLSFSRVHPNRYFRLPENYEEQYSFDFPYIDWITEISIGINYKL